MKKILIPIPSYGCDPSEVAIPWKMFTKNKFKIVFATPIGEKANADAVMLNGKGLGPLKRILIARKDAREAYNEMYKSKEFSNPIAYADIKETDFDAIFLPGGHDKGVREYLESKTLQNVVVDFFENNKKIAAVCHGVVLLARSINIKTGKSVLYNYKTTALLKQQELLAYNLTKLWVDDYYLTYSTTVEDEVVSVLESKENFKHGSNPLFRDTLQNLKPGFIVRDKNYVSARWPGDIYNLSLEFIKMLNEK